MTRSRMASASVGIDGNLTGDDERALVITIFDDFQEIARASVGPQSSRMNRFTRAIDPSNPAERASPCATASSANGRGMRVWGTEMLSRQCLRPSARPSQLLQRPLGPTTYHPRTPLRGRGRIPSSPACGIPDSCRSPLCPCESGPLCGGWPERVPGAVARVDDRVPCGDSPHGRHPAISLSVFRAPRDLVRAHCLTSSASDETIPQEASDEGTAATQLGKTRSPANGCFGFAQEGRNRLSF
jgi:hypothetical protein